MQLLWILFLSKFLAIVATDNLEEEDEDYDEGDDETEEGSRVNKLRKWETNKMRF